MRQHGDRKFLLDLVFPSGIIHEPFRVAVCAYISAMPYPARQISFNPRDFATHQSLLRVAAYSKSASGTARQAAIDYVVTAHGFSKDHTKSLLYEASLKLPGRNIRGDIRIGPEAFDQDQSWLAGIVFHELVHSPQAAYYASKGVTQIDPKRSETERLMIALDEYEAYWWSLKRSAELGLSSAQQAEIRRRAQHAFIDLDEPKAKALAQKQQFDAARDELISQHNAKSQSNSKSPNAPVARSRSNSFSCCA